MKIVFDTNIWVSQLGLNSEAGVAVRFYIKQKGASVVVPEVVRLELERNFTCQLHHLKKTIVDSHRKLLTVFGKLKEVVLPSEDELNNKASDILNSLDVPIQEIPFSFDAARSSFLKIIDGQPPSSNKNQQFKDGVIWANCLELLHESDVYFVTEDKSFYQDRDYGNGPALNLQEETEKYPNKLTLISSLEKLLDDIRADVDIDGNSLIKGIFEASGDRIYEVLNKAEFSLGETPTITINLFLTEKSSQLYMEFEISYECSDKTEQGRINASLGLKGTGLYETEKEEFLKVSLTYFSLQYIDTEGQQQSRGFHYLSASAVAGYRTVEHIVRLPLPDK